MQGVWVEEQGDWPVEFDGSDMYKHPRSAPRLRSFKEMDVFLAIYEDMFYNAGVDLVSSTSAWLLSQRTVVQWLSGPHACMCSSNWQPI